MNIPSSHVFMVIENSTGEFEVWPDTAEYDHTKRSPCREALPESQDGQACRCGEIVAGLSNDIGVLAMKPRSFFSFMQRKGESRLFQIPSSSAVTRGGLCYA